MELAGLVTPVFWAGFISFVLAMLALDLFVLGGRTAHKVSAREALGWTGVWVTLSLSFCALLWGWLDGTAGRAVANAKALEFLTGYLIELSLSVDNIFVFIMIFSYFAVPAEYQRRVLVYGVLGAIVMRFSRQREFRADAGGATLAGRQKMIAALRRLQAMHEPAALPDKMAAFGIAGGVGGGLKRLFMTHPPIEERIAALEAANAGVRR